jgi:hypothetical protein
MPSFANSTVTSSMQFMGDVGYCRFPLWPLNRVHAGDLNHSLHRRTSGRTSQREAHPPPHPRHGIEVLHQRYTVLIAARRRPKAFRLLDGDAEEGNSAPGHMAP